LNDKLVFCLEFPLLYGVKLLLDKLVLAAGGALVRSADCGGLRRNQKTAISLVEGDQRLNRPEKMASPAMRANNL